MRIHLQQTYAFGSMSWCLAFLVGFLNLWLVGPRMDQLGFSSRLRWILGQRSCTSNPSRVSLPEVRLIHISHIFTCVWQKTHCKWQGLAVWMITNVNRWKHSMLARKISSLVSCLFSGNPMMRSLVSHPQWFPHGWCFFTGFTAH